MIVRICPAISTGTAAVAEVVDTDDLECETFTALLRDPIKPVSPATKVTLKTTDIEVDVLHMDTSNPMTADQNLILAEHSDGYWFVLVWIC